MATELVFRISVALIGLFLFIIRVYYLRGYISPTRNGEIARKDRIRMQLPILAVVYFLACFAMLIYVVAPGWLAWASLPLPVILRWVGVGLGSVSVPLLLWVHRTLGKNWANPGETQKRQTLVTSGPYRWVRHPMYTLAIAAGVSFFLASANGLIGLLWLGLITIIIATLGVEEVTLIEKFGESYHAYMLQTGRLLPRL